MKEREQVSRAELMMVLRSLERQGLIVSSLHSDGQVRWRITEKGSSFVPWQLVTDTLN
jgi:DNA-binding PadR family transcriptional regulator